MSAVNHQFRLAVRLAETFASASRTLSGWVRVSSRSPTPNRSRERGKSSGKPPLSDDDQWPLCANSGRLLNGEVGFAADSAERLRAEAKLRGSNPAATFRQKPSWARLSRTDRYELAPNSPAQAASPTSKRSDTPGGSVRRAAVHSQSRTVAMAVAGLPSWARTPG
jgi:hypothetical protein